MMALWKAMGGGSLNKELAFEMMALRKAKGGKSEIKS